jgi:hypothetical protein
MADEITRPVWKSRVRRFVAFALVAVVASCGTQAWSWLSKRTPPLPLIAQGLPGGNLSRARGDALTQQLYDRFPVGSPEFDLVRELWLEGFQPRTDLPTPQRGARFEFSAGMCDYRLDVDWSVDGSGHLSKISGHDSLDCP